MATCDQCGEEENMPYECRYCGGTYCADHRLPENHSCPGLEQWDDPDGVWDDTGSSGGGIFDSGFDDSVRDGGSRSGAILDRIGIDTGTGGSLGYFRGNMTYVFLALMWITFFVQQLFEEVLIPTGPTTIDPGMLELYRSIFYLTTDNPLYVWTWITSIFSHGGFWHIIGNSIVIFFFGRIVERAVGSREYTALFIVSGILAGLGQIAIITLQSPDPGAVLGASGAGLAIMGTLTVLNPDLQVYIWGVLPMPIWAITAFYAGISVLGMIGPVAGGVANAAHLVGLVIGLWYGNRVKGRISTPRQLQFGGGPGGPGGGRRRF